MCQCFSAGKLNKTGNPLFVILSAGYLAAGILEPVRGGGEKPVGVTGAQEVNKTGWMEKAAPVYLFLKLPDKKDVNE